MRNSRMKILTMLIALMVMALPLNALAASTQIAAEDGASLNAIVQEAVSNGYTHIQVNVSGTLNYVTGPSYGSDDLSKLTSIQELKIVGTTSSAKFVQTGVGVEAMGLTNGKLIFQNITVEDTTVYRSENGESAWEFCYAEYSGNVEFNNCVIRGEYGGIMTNGNARFIDCDFISEKTSNHGGTEYAVWVNNGSGYFYNCTFTGRRALKAHEDYGSNVTSVVVEACKFENVSEKPGIVLGDLDSTSVVEVVDSTFINCAVGDQGRSDVESDTLLTEFQFTIVNNPAPAAPSYTAPKTGDNSNLMLWASMMIVAGIGLVVASRKRLGAER